MLPEADVDYGSVATARVALVTGAGRGIGRAIASELAGAGVAVALLGRSQQPLAAAVAEIAAGGGRALAIPCDVRDAAAVERAVERTTRELGTVDLLVNNAGTMASGPFAEIPADDWWRDVEVSLRGALHATRAVLPAMVEGGGGRIVNMSSRIATRADPWCSSYACAKAALTRMSECLAAELGDRGVRVFALSPGVVPTDMTAELQRTHWIGDDLRAMAPDEWSSPQDAARVVARIAAGEADVLAGRFVDVALGLDAQLAGAAAAVAEDRWTLRLRD